MECRFITCPAFLIHRLPSCILTSESPRHWLFRHLPSLLMDMSSLFPSEGPGQLAAQEAPHVTFRAGILTRDPTTNQVTPDPRKGTFQITTSPEDGLMHLQWRPRNHPTVEQDLILFSGETEMKLVSSCPPTARVYVLKWREADTRMFFWMQSSDCTQDAANISAVNSILEHGPQHQQV